MCILFRKTFYMEGEECKMTTLTELSQEDTHMKLLVNETPLQLLPSVVHEVGMNEAVFLQQLHFRSLISKNIRDGHKWVYNTYDG